MGIDHNRQQQTEKYFFEQFSKVYTSLPAGEITYGDKPDVIIKGKNSSLGIEITNLYVKNVRENISKKENLILRAHKIFKQTQSAENMFFFAFSKYEKIEKINGIAKDIAQLTKTLTDHPIGPIKSELFEHIPQLFSVYHSGVIEGKQWALLNAYSAPYVDQKHLEDTIRSKESKANGYKHCDSLWLLVVIDFINSAQDQILREEHLQKIKSEKFEKIIIFKTGYDEIVEM